MLSSPCDLDIQSEGPTTPFRFRQFSPGKRDEMSWLSNGNFYRAESDSISPFSPFMKLCIRILSSGRVMAEVVIVADAVVVVVVIVVIVVEVVVVVAIVMTICSHRSVISAINDVQQ